MTDDAATPATEAGRELLRSFQQPDERFTNHVVRLAVLAIEAEARATAGIDALEALESLRDVLATIEKAYSPGLGWYVHPVYIRAAKLVDRLTEAQEKP